MRGVSRPRLEIIFSFLVKMAASFKHLSQLKPYLPYIIVLLVVGSLFCALGYCVHKGFVHAPALMAQGFDNPSEQLVMYYADW